MIHRLVLTILFLLHFTCIAQIDDIQLISWNIKDFGKTKNNEELHRIADIVKESDILAIQEVVAGYGGAQAVARLTDNLNRMGSKWDYVISDPTNSPKYVSERYAIIWKTHRIKIKNRGWLISALDATIDREPFLLNLYMDGKSFTVINFHSRPYNKDPESEIMALSEYIRDSIKNPLVIAGDFNVDERMPVFGTLKNSGYQTAVTNQKTSLKWKCEHTEYLNHPIDNIFIPRKSRK
ncbi:MAG: endonuclease/exonuclease/phosphatase family protein [Flavobacteriaceae bacterium]|nr:endonuclease/exonuclease/phosphatase family protein [Flavobacteriaceae bacterium]